MSAVEIADMPEGVVTVTSTVPAAWAGLVAVIEVALTTVTPVAAVLPKLTAVAPVKFVPVMVTGVLPTVVPVAGEMPVMVGADVAVIFAIAIFLARRGRHSSPASDVL